MAPEPEAAVNVVANTTQIGSMQDVATTLLVSRMNTTNTNDNSDGNSNTDNDNDENENKSFGYRYESYLNSGLVGMIYVVACIMIMFDF